ncbi:hypothetical protein OUZ56_020986 [Daphnia magna]|uniref:Uncharacterized protein n=1 Tax=Daphnia magna TaxID=35525 RepID=A0ABQ9ZG23_9CRUS|nr:hypothetical protein OUZ56_020986 [Daphnia magna]
MDESFISHREQHTKTLKSLKNYQRLKSKEKKVLISRKLRFIHRKVFIAELGNILCMKGRHNLFNAHNISRER